MNMENMNHHDHGQHETMTMKTMNHHAWHLPPWAWKHKPPWLWKTWNHDHGKPEPPWLWKTQTTTLENMNHHEHGKKPCTWFEARPCRKTWTWKTYEPPWTCMNHHVHGKNGKLEHEKKNMNHHVHAWKLMTWHVTAGVPTSALRSRREKFNLSSSNTPSTRSANKPRRSN